MKQTETHEELIQRFTKRVIELNKKLSDLQEAYDEYIKIEKDICRLQGSIQVVEYLAYGKLPHDGNHTNMQNHMPRKNQHE